MFGFRGIASLFLIFCWMVVEKASSTLPTAGSLKTSLSASEDAGHDILSYLQREQTAVTMAQSQIVQFLQNKKIPIGQEPTTHQTPHTTDTDTLLDRIAISTSKNPIECRITLDTATEGSICVAPCSCAGSQKWVELSVFNKLRRKNPSQWLVCQTCKQPYRYDLLQAQSSLEANILGLLLDRPLVVRAALLLGGVCAGWALQLHVMFQKLLVSEAFWKMVSA